MAREKKPLSNDSSQTLTEQLIHLISTSNSLGLSDKLKEFKTNNSLHKSYRNKVRPSSAKELNPTNFKSFFFADSQISLNEKIKALETKKQGFEKAGHLYKYYVAISIIYMGVNEFIKARTAFEKAKDEVSKGSILDIEEKQFNQFAVSFQQQLDLIQDQTSAIIESKEEILSNNNFFIAASAYRERFDYAAALATVEAGLTKKNVSKSEITQLKKMKINLMLDLDKIVAANELSDDLLQEYINEIKSSNEIDRADVISLLQIDTVRHIYSGAFKLARITLSYLMQTQPDKGIYYAYCALIFAAEQKPTLARSYLNKAQQLSPNSIEIRRLKIEEEIANRNMKSALEHIDRILNEYPNNMEAISLKLMILFITDLNEYMQFLEANRKALGDTYYKIYLVRAIVANGGASKAEENFEELVELDLSTINCKYRNFIFLNLAEINFNKGESYYGKAKNYLSKIKERENNLSPNSSQTLYYLEIFTNISSDQGKVISLITKNHAKINWKTYEAKDLNRIIELFKDIKEPNQKQKDAHNCLTNYYNNHLQKTSSINSSSSNDMNVSYEDEKEETHVGLMQLSPAQLSSDNSSKSKIMVTTALSNTSIQKSKASNKSGPQISNRTIDFEPNIIPSQFPIQKQTYLEVARQKELDAKSEERLHTLKFKIGKKDFYYTALIDDEVLGSLGENEKNHFETRVQNFTSVLRVNSQGRQGIRDVRGTNLAQLGDFEIVIKGDLRLFGSLYPAQDIKANDSNGKNLGLIIFDCLTNHNKMKRDISK